MSSLIQPRPEFAGILKPAESFGSGQSRGLADGINGWFDTLMLQSGMEAASPLMPLWSLYTGIALGGLLFVIHENLLSTAIAAMTGFLLPIAVVMMLRARRQKIILAQIPRMMDELIRTIQSGRGVEHGLRMAADNTPAPLGPELKLATQRIELGLPLAEAILELPRRTGLSMFHSFNAALVEQQRTGGDLTLLRQCFTPIAEA